MSTTTPSSMPSPTASAPTLDRDLRSLVDLLRRRAEEAPEHRAYTFLADSGAEEGHLTWGELDERARAIGVQLEGAGAAGRRALLLYPPGLEFIAAFLGCLYGGAVAVPAYPPRSQRTLPRLLAIARDARPAVALTSSDLLPKIEALGAQVPELGALRLVATDGFEYERAELAEAWRDPGATGETLAFLQYTSGSTAAPKGVMVSHGNLLHNEEIIRQAFGQTAESIVAGWLPLYHDMGLIGNLLQPLYVGARCVLMSPYAFLQQPVRWLEAISKYRATTSGGPNFAYELCVRKVGEAAKERLDLSSWRVAFNGAEPVRAESLERFAEAFAPCGFRRDAFSPCYGLAEATLFVTGGGPGAGARVERVEPAELERGRAVPAPGGRALVGCGHTWGGQDVRVVDPESGAPVEDGRVGEIWVSGPSIARGYWGHAEATGRDFSGKLAEGSEGRLAESSAGDEAPYLRTGDLGFLLGGELFVTGRIKDLIILRGRNLYPQDVELTAERSHPALRPGCGAAFAVDAEGEERLILVQEVDKGAEGSDLQPAIEAIRRAVAEEHEARVWDVVLVREGTVPKTSSGKIQRHACRAGYLGGKLDALARGTLAATAEAAPPPEETLLG